MKCKSKTKFEKRNEKGMTNIFMDGVKNWAKIPKKKNGKKI